MRRGGPTYDLHELQRLIGQGPLSSMIMTSARIGATALGFGEPEIVEAVLMLTTDHFYKTMEAEQVPGLWQDVYHLEYQSVPMYIKLQQAADGRAVVVQFKRK